MQHRLARLSRRFRLQEEFATGYSPLYARLFGVVAEWLEAPDAAGDPLVNWLLEASAGRGTLDVSLLLPAGLHRDVLARAAGQEIPSVDKLARYFPTAGGDKNPEVGDFEGALRQAIMARRDTLSGVIRSGNVQTNETGRGLCWLLPLACVPWKAVHLVDLGASAGLNLVADYRAYRLVGEGSDETRVDFGRGRPPQFLARCRGETTFLRSLASNEPPAIISRTGCDLAPFRLTGQEDELTLMSFVWGDQAERLQRLREGTAALRQVERAEGSIALHVTELPDGLDSFLRNRVSADDGRPVVLYNTYMTMYLRDKGASLSERIGVCAAEQQRPVLWLQWEPPRDGREPPGLGWCAWTADLWQGAAHQRWRLGWAHPHGAAVEFAPGFGTFVANFAA